MYSTRCSHSAFTLIELMASIVLLTLAASIGAVGLASAGKAAAFNRAFSAVAGADRSARVLATESGPVRLKTAKGGAQLALISVADTSVIQENKVPAGILIEFVDPALEMSVVAINYDSRGRCDDFYAHVLSGGRTRAWRIAGLTGWAEQLERPTP